MNATLSITIIIYYILSISNIAYLFGKYKVCPELMTSVLQLIMFFGITNYVDLSNECDRELLLIYAVGLLSYIIGEVFFLTLFRPKRIMQIESNYGYYNIRKPYTFIIIVFSIVICSLFYIRGGGNVFLNGIRALFSGQQYSTKYARMSLLSVSGVGYVYQIRVIIFPLIVLYYIMVNKRKLTSAALAVLALIFLIGTGQRGGLVSVMAIYVLTVYYWMRRRNEDEQVSQFKKIRTYVLIISIALALFGLSTIMNGRVSSGGSVFSSIVRRFLADNQNSAIYAFRYIKTQPIQYGYDWFSQMKDVLPGKNTYDALDTRVFAYIYGGSRAGTAPPCIWGSAYYNFGYFGIVLIGFAQAFISTKTHSLFTRRDNDEFSIICYSGLQFLSAYWVAGGPVNLVNNGFVSVILLYMLMKLALRFRIVFGTRGKRPL